jgi:hypothetical protein
VQQLSAALKPGLSPHPKEHPLPEDKPMTKQVQASFLGFWRHTAGRVALSKDGENLSSTNQHQQDD